MGRFTAFRFTVDPSPDQVVVLARHAGASRFAYNQSLRLVKDALTAQSADCSVQVPWSRFDVINAFNGWKVSAAAGRLLVADASGEVTVVATGLAWRTEVSSQVFEEVAVDLSRGLAAYSASRRGQRAGRRMGFPGSSARVVSGGRFGSGRRPAVAVAAYGWVRMVPGR